MSKYETYIKKMSKIYIDHSINVENKVRRFKKKLCCVNKKSGEFFKIKHEPQKVQKDNYLWFMFNTMIQVEKSKKSNEVGIFLTCTLSTQFHKFTKFDKQGKELETPRLNPNYNPETTLHDGYEVLNNFFRDLYKNFKVDRKHVKIKFSKVIEYNHDFTPHLHAGLYVEEEHLEKFKEFIVKQIKSHQIGKHYKIEEIRDVMKLSGYISKYMRKTMNSDNEEDFHLLNGWKKINKIRNFTSSNIEVFRYIYKKVNTVTELSKNLDKKNPIVHLLDNCQINIKTYDKKNNKLIKEKKYKKENQNFIVEVERERNIKIKQLYDENHETIRYKKIYQYKIIKFKIYDKEGRVWYNNTDYEYFYNMTEEEYSKKDEKIEMKFIFTETEKTEKKEIEKIDVEEFELNYLY